MVAWKPELRTMRDMQLALNMLAYIAADRAPDHRQAMRGPSHLAFLPF